MSKSKPISYPCEWCAAQGRTKEFPSLVGLQEHQKNCFNRPIEADVANEPPMETSPPAMPSISKTPLQAWRSHKTVKAFKIGSIAPCFDGAVLTETATSGENEEQAQFPCQAFVGSAYLTKHDPQVGGYYVEYEDGYQSWSPAAAFEGGYLPLYGDNVAGVPVSALDLPFADDAEIAVQAERDLGSLQRAYRAAMQRINFAEHTLKAILDVCVDDLPSSGVDKFLLNMARTVHQHVLNCEAFAWKPPDHSTMRRSFQTQQWEAYEAACKQDSHGGLVAASKWKPPEGQA